MEISWFTAREGQLVWAPYGQSGDWSEAVIRQIGRKQGPEGDARVRVTYPVRGGSSWKRLSQLKLRR